MPGEYTVTYDVSDSTGNAATQVSRSVVVEDTLPPSITLLGSSSVTIECGDGYTDAGATATDQCDGELTDELLVVNPVDPDVPGEYTITYDIADAAENAATQVTRNVTVEDSTAPTITLTGEITISLECGDSFEDLGATAFDECDDDLTENIDTVGTVDTTVPGEYTIEYDVVDAAGNAATQAVRTITVVDSPPAITLLGESEVTIECSASYADAGATAFDRCDLDVTDDLTVVNPVDISVPGTYTITYDVSDSADQPAAQVTRTVIVADTTEPAITLLGEPTIFMECGDAYVDAGATAADDCGLDLTDSIVTVNPADTDSVGVYTITYDVSDASGNAAAQVTRSVFVGDTRAPTLALVGPEFMTTDCGSPFLDPGATAADDCQSDIVDRISKLDLVNTSIPGEYTIRYFVSDASGLLAPSVSRTVQVLDNCSDEGEPLEEGEVDGEGPPEGEAEGSGEGRHDGEGLAGGEGDGAGEGIGSLMHAADTNGDSRFDLREVLRVIQLYNADGYQCASGTEDGFMPGHGGCEGCARHASDYLGDDCAIGLSELLRLIQFFNTGGYYRCPDAQTDDGFCHLPG